MSTPLNLFELKIALERQSVKENPEGVDNTIASYGLWELGLPAMKAPQHLDIEALIAAPTEALLTGSSQ
ncbi:hypothetical protein [Pseudomonas viridiflava]|uniref:hypothetical protein n=1 Tax=Pseudomonas viridiflava TaxID=33069 RepID=UPI0013C2D3ED|nr:hypothetical protein [Pseudomonas viridiflava]